MANIIILSSSGKLQSKQILKSPPVGELIQRYLTNVTQVTSVTGLLANRPGLAITNSGEWDKRWKIYKLMLPTGQGGSGSVLLCVSLEVVSPPSLRQVECSTLALARPSRPHRPFWNCPTHLTKGITLRTVLNNCTISIAFRKPKHTEVL